MILQMRGLQEAVAIDGSLENCTWNTVHKKRVCRISSQLFFRFDNIVILMACIFDQLREMIIIIA